MATYRLVYNSRHLQADSQEPGSALEPYATLRSVIEYGLPFTFFYYITVQTLRAVTVLFFSMLGDKHTHTHLTALFRDYPGEPVPGR